LPCFQRFSFGNTIKREAEIADAHAQGINLFAFDTIAELEKLSRAAPGAQVYCRFLADDGVATRVPQDIAAELEQYGVEFSGETKFSCLIFLWVATLR